jgi:multiple sugar transport system permease protein
MSSATVSTQDAAAKIGRTGFLYWLTQDTIVGLKRRRALLGYLFLLPTMLGIFIFTAGPVFVSFGLSLFRWNIFKPPDFIGLDNFERLARDVQFRTSFGNTLEFVVLAVSIQLALGLFLALSVYRLMSKLQRYYFRTAFFLPILLSGTAVSVVLGYMFHTEFGAVNYYLGLLGLPRIPWMTSSDWVILTVVLASVWRNLGFTFVAFLGGLANISTEVLEAADVDGAQGWRRLYHITIPLLSPTILFATVTGVVGALQVFEEPYIMTRGGPGDASRTAVMVMFEAAFKNIEFGYGAAMAVVLFLVILAVTVTQMWLSRRWVFYQ